MSKIAGRSGIRSSLEMKWGRSAYPDPFAEKSLWVGLSDKEIADLARERNWHFQPGMNFGVPASIVSFLKSNPITTARVSDLTFTPIFTAVGILVANTKVVQHEKGTRAR